MNVICNTTMKHFFDSSTFADETVPNVAWHTLENPANDHVLLEWLSIEPEAAYKKKSTSFLVCASELPVVYVQPSQNK